MAAMHPMDQHPDTEPGNGQEPPATPVLFDMSTITVQLLEFEDEEYLEPGPAASVEQQAAMWELWCRWSDMGAVPAGAVDVLLLPPGADPVATFDRLRPAAHPLTGGLVPSIYVGPPVTAAVGEFYGDGFPLSRFGDGVVFGHPNTVEFAMVASDAAGLLVGEWEALDEAADVELGEWRRMLISAGRLVAEQA